MRFSNVYKMLFMLFFITFLGGCSLPGWVPFVNSNDDLPEIDVDLEMRIIDAQGDTIYNYTFYRGETFLIEVKMDINNNSDEDAKVQAEFLFPNAENVDITKRQGNFDVDSNLRDADEYGNRYIEYTLQPFDSRSDSSASLSFVFEIIVVDSGEELEASIKMISETHDVITLYPYMEFDFLESPKTPLVSPIIKLSSNGEKVQWDEDEDVDDYQLTIYAIQDESEDMVMEELRYYRNDKLLSNLEPGHYKLRLVANGDGDYQDSKPQFFEFQVLEAPLINVSDKTLEISVVEDANEYGVFIDSNLLHITDSRSIDLNTLDLDELDTGQFLDLTVHSISGNANEVQSSSSNIENILILDDMNIEREGENITWRTVDRADEYHIYVDGEFYETTTNNKYRMPSSSVGEIIQVKSVSNQGHILDSRLSNSIALEIL